MMNANTNTTTKNNAMGKNTARVYNGRNTKASLKERIRAYFEEVVEFYGDIARRSGYRAPMGF